MKRNNNLDILRIIACVFVIFIHVSGNYINRYSGENNSYCIIANIFDAFSRSAVPIFIMISGYLLLNDDRNMNCKYFYKKSFCKIVIPTITWSFIYFVFYEFLEVLKGGHEKNLLRPVYNWIKGIPAPHLWYMYMIIGMYLVTPFLINLRNKSENKLLKCGFVFLLLGMVLYNYNFIWIIQFIQYLGYFIFGYFISKIKKIKYPTLYIMGWFVSSSIACIGTCYIGNDSLYSYLSIPVVISSICIFKGILALDVNIETDNISKHTFNIYLVHFMIVTFFSKLLSIIGLDNYPIISILCTSCIVFIISFILSKSIYYLKNRFRIINLLF